MTENRYVIRGGEAGRERLRILARVMQPTTRSLLERAGVREGIACLDVGCGGGDGSVELARLVGPSGRVLGVDLDAEKIEVARREAAALQLSQIEFQVSEASLRGTAAEFDVVFARFLLTHLGDSAAAVRHMIERLRPGGVAIVEDIDFRGHFCHPELAAFQRYVELYTQVVRRRGADPDIGPRLPELLLDAGCEAVGVQVVQPAGIDGEVKRIAAITMENIADALLAAELASQEEIDAIIGALFAAAADGRTLMSLPRIVQAWGRRPAAAA
ncbi:MAG: methyltransferase domain-containing protein [bacterium]